MFGAFVRAAATFAAGMLVASIFRAILDPILPIIKNGVNGTGGVGGNSVLYQAFSSAQDNFVLFVLASVLLGLLVRALVEQQLPTGGRL